MPKIDYQRELAAMGVTLENLLALDVQVFAGKLEAEIAAMRIQGMAEESIYQVLLKDAQESGRLFGEFSNTIKLRIYGGLKQASRVGEHAIYHARGISTDLLKWVTIGKNCPDCDTRAGREEPAEIWATIGEPGTGWSLCRSACDCRLVPVSIKLPNRTTL